MKDALYSLLHGPVLKGITPSQIGAAFFVLFWLATLVAFVLARRRIARTAYLGFFLFALILPGLAGGHLWLWPFYTWHLWGGIQPRQAEYYELYVVDGSGQRFLYDRKAIPPILDTQMHDLARRLLQLPPGESADELTTFLLQKANARRSLLLAGDPRPPFPAFPSRQLSRGWDAELLAHAGPFDRVLARRMFCTFSPDARQVDVVLVEERLFP